MPQRFTVDDLKRSILDSNLDPHSLVAVDNGDEELHELDFRRTGGQFMIYTAPSGKQDRIDKLEETAWECDQKLEELHGLIDNLTLAKKVKDEILQLIEQIQGKIKP